MPRPGTWTGNPGDVPAFKKDAAALVIERGYSMAKVAQAVDTSENNLRSWSRKPGVSG